MKDSLNFFLPIMEEDDTSVISNRNELRSITNISSNGYYGYQPVVEKHIQNGINCEQSMEVQMSDSDIQFNNFIPVEENCQQQKETMDNRDKLKRKRCWGYDYETEYPEFKKWRENDKLFNKEKRRNTEKKSATEGTPHNGLLEDLLREIHGCSSYHWISEKLTV
ncbi:uncharacterized protein LOC108737996 isoform X1 [Agrilus planipennis]|uniref:Uncharacterized protein LOC108737996 isoform X1 n=1 Tax=Agrilus planipennis TaxID=224129 RepID=A0A1W4WS20_AGRPL|nr:uncharacterized protein LOC108737996 isoform X1 [Agrilus planipennis]